MKSIDFKESNIILGEDQKEYNNAFALMVSDGDTVLCFKLTFFERLKLLLTGKIWYCQKTFNNGFNPMFLEIKKPII